MTVAIPVPLQWEDKDPDEVLDYDCDWTTRLAGDTISTSTWTIKDPDAVLVINSQLHDASTTTVWLAGGTLNETYELTNEIVTGAGRRMDQTVLLRISSK